MKKNTKIEKSKILLQKALLHLLNVDVIYWALYGLTLFSIY